MFDFPIKETAEKRKSIRTYTGKPLSSQDKEKINSYIDYLKTAPSPFEGKVRICLFEASPDSDIKHLGTYGVIKDAKNFLGVAVEKCDTAEEAAGYTFEKLVLYAQSIGLGTCWLGGTYNKSEFANAMNIKENEIFHIVSPIGYPAEKTHLLNKIMRTAIKADFRKPWSTMFFDKSFDTPLSESNAGDFAFVLEMTRLSPSAANKQPWRLVKDGNNLHFYEKREMADENSSFDMQKLDVGIAACHFELAAKEKGLKGNFIKADPGLETPEKTIYLFSWIADETEV